MLQYKTYDNKSDAVTWRYTSTTESAAASLAQTMKKCFGVRIVDRPYKRQDGMWVFSFTNPFLAGE